MPEKLTHDEISSLEIWAIDERFDCVSSEIMQKLAQHHPELFMMLTRAEQLEKDLRNTGIIIKILIQKL